MAQSIDVPNGVVNIDNAGVISFTPDANFNGDVEFDYTITDGTTAVSATETITVTPVNDAPVAVDDVGSGPLNQPVLIDVLGNDTDPDGDIDPTSVIITQSPAGGTIAADGKSVIVAGEGTWSVDGTTRSMTILVKPQMRPLLPSITPSGSGSPVVAITFTPEAGFTGDPTPISYTVDDNTGETSNEATVTIDYPQAINDLQTGTSGSPVVVDVFDNDSAASANLDPTSVIITQSPAGGTIAADGKSVIVAGEGTWSVDGTTGAITFTPEAGFTGDPTPISYTVDDNTGETSNEATVTIDYPQAINDLQTGTSGSPVVVDVFDNDSAASANLDPTSVIITQSPAGGTIAADGKSVIVAGEGTWSVDGTTGAITFTPEAGFTGDPTPISYTVDDNTGETSNEATVTIDYPQAPVANK
ncbi:tandem-95 repeat protein [Psychrobacter fjordensis]|uniref:tandem-95 repeat protein n=1 Tax=Psychrobacter fjordensis TaxID=664424 RepID=UPI00191B6744|nr:tandem-95 repeat protein [Psychrobacter fjordensis]